MSNWSFTPLAYADPGGSTGWWDDMVNAIVSGSNGSAVVVQGRNGAVGDGVTNSTAGINAAIAAAPAGGTVLFGPGLWLTDALTITKPITLTSVGGRFAAWLKPRTAITTPLVTFSLPTSSGTGSNRNLYGPSVVNLGMDLYAAPQATGIDFAYNSGGGGHPLVRDVYIQGGNVSINVAQANGWIEDCALFDADRMIVVNGDQGAELTLRDLYLGRNVAGTTTAAVDVTSSTSGPKGAIYAHNIRLSVNYPTGTATYGFRAVAATTYTSLPLFLNSCIFDNVTTALKTTNISDVEVNGGWYNSGNLGPAYEVEGGRDIKLRDATWFGGPSGTPSSIKFLGGNTDYLSTSGNRFHTNPIFRMPASGAPTNLYPGNDILWVGDPSTITNDLTLFRAALGKRHQYGLEIDDVPIIKEVANGPSGLVALSGGTATVAHTQASASNTVIHATHRIISGTPGNLILQNVTDATSFTIQSWKADGTLQTADNSTVAWFMYRRT